MTMNHYNQLSIKILILRDLFVDYADDESCCRRCNKSVGSNGLFYLTMKGNNNIFIALIQIVCDYHVAVVIMLDILFVGYCCSERK